MKTPKFVIFSLIAASIALIYISCKDNNTVTPVTPPTQNSNSPALVSPPNEITSQVGAPLMDWQDFNGAVSYHLQISLDANYAGTMLIDTNNLTASQFQVPQSYLPTGVYFYWRVIANLSQGQSSWSSTWRFRIILSAPPAPQLTSPPDQSNNQPFLPLFQWNAAPTAQYYRIQVSEVSNFNSILLDSSTITVTQLQCPQFVLNTGSQYYWRVNASNSNGVSVGPWSSTFTFTTAAGPMPNTISGTVTLVDTNVVHPVYPYYIVAAYNSWPPTTFSPFQWDTLNLVRSGNTYQSTYRIHGLPDDQYRIAVYYFATPLIFNEPVLGIYGCDTSHIQFSNCPGDPTRLTITNGAGLENINVLSWADTTKRIF